MGTWTSLWPVWDDVREHMACKQSLRDIWINKHKQINKCLLTIKPFKRLHIVIESTIWTLHKMGSQENTWLIQCCYFGSLKKCWTIGKAVKDLQEIKSRRKREVQISEATWWSFMLTLRNQVFERAWDLLTRAKFTVEDVW